MIEGTTDLTGEFWSNVLIVLAVLVALWILWGLLRALVEFLDDRINFLSFMTPGDIAGAIMLGALGVLVLAAILTAGSGARQ